MEEFTAMWDTVEYPKGKIKPDAKDIFNVVNADMSAAVEFDEFVAFVFDPRIMEDEAFEQYIRSAFSSLAQRGETSEEDAIGIEALAGIFSEDVRPLVDILFEE